LADLGAFLEQAGRKPFAWGGHDCLLFAADWCRIVAGCDPADAYRGRYATRLGAERILRREGGMLALAERTMTMLEVDGPALAGDVGVVIAPTTDGRFTHVGAIFNGRLWTVLKVHAGLVAAPFTVVKSWRP
jgi:hypothetical protein